MPGTTRLIGAIGMTAVAVMLLVSGTVRADITIDTVTVGDPGNAADTAAHSGNPAGQGSVAYTYNIGKYEVTAGQYTAFLNAVGGVDTYSLYDLLMSQTSDGRGNGGSGITRIGGGTAANPYTYSVAADFVNRPVNCVSFWDACRFTNWLNNGQPTDAQGVGTTETGAYTLLHSTQRNANATWVVASEDEWYKAAYYKGGSTNAGYWDYPTSSNTAPGRDMADASGNNANYYNGSGNYFIEHGHCTTVVGEFQNSPGPYGTFDQGGNVCELNEITGRHFMDNRYGVRGGGWASYDGQAAGFTLASSYRGLERDLFEKYADLGFRVVELPEPATMAILALGSLGLFIRRRAKTKGTEIMQPKARAIIVAVVAMILSAGTVQADVFNLGGTRDPITGAWTGMASLETVTVGDPGNAGNTNNGGRGSVAYTYNIGKYEVTAGQYTAFLNAVGKVDTYTLYSGGMSRTDYGSGITRSGSSGNYMYTVASNFANRPVNLVTFWDACRFVNWLSNGQPTGTQGAGTTETGSYTLTPDGIASNTVTRNSGATWAVTNEIEWYKAAYYKGGSTNAGYWDYPTRSNTAPGNDMADVSGNNANYYPGYLSSQLQPIDNGKYTTVVGEFQNSPGPYGTFDQGGNVAEWNDTAFGAGMPERIIHSGGFNESSVDNWAGYNAQYMTYNLGFRVVELPEPCTMALLAIGSVGMLIRRRTLWC